MYIYQKGIQEGKNILNEDEKFIETRDKELPEKCIEFQEKLISFI